METHWGEHHHGYVEGLNKQLEKNDILYGYTLDELVKVTYNNGNPLSEFNNAAQVCPLFFSKCTYWLGCILLGNLPFRSPLGLCS